MLIIVLLIVKNQCSFRSFYCKYKITFSRIFWENLKRRHFLKFFFFQKRRTCQKGEHVSSKLSLLSSESMFSWFLADFRCLLDSFLGEFDPRRASTSILAWLCSRYTNPEIDMTKNHFKKHLEAIGWGGTHKIKF